MATDQQIEGALREVLFFGDLKSWRLVGDEMSFYLAECLAWMGDGLRSVDELTIQLVFQRLGSESCELKGRDWVRENIRTETFTVKLLPVDTPCALLKRIEAAVYGVCVHIRNVLRPGTPATSGAPACSGRGRARIARVA